MDPVVSEPRLQRHLPRPILVAARVPERDGPAAARVLELPDLHYDIVDGRAPHLLRLAVLEAGVPLAELVVAPAPLRLHG